MPQYGNVPPPQPPRGGAPVVLDAGKKAARHTLLGGSVAGGMGILTLYSSMTGHIIGGPGAHAFAWFLGVIFTGIGLLAVLTWKFLVRPMRLVFDANGITWDDPRGKPWSVSWPELAGVALSRTQRRGVLGSNRTLPSVLVRLDLFPADPSFRQRHQGMEHLWERHRVRNGYRLPLGQAPDYIPLIDDAMRRFRPQIYGGVHDEGFVVGLR